MHVSIMSARGADHAPPRKGDPESSPARRPETTGEYACGSGPCHSTEWSMVDLHTFTCAAHAWLVRSQCVRTRHVRYARNNDSVDVASRTSEPAADEPVGRSLD